MSVDVVVIGLGYVGLPLAAAACRADLSVIGLDLNHEVLHGLSLGRSHIDDLSDADIVAMHATGFTATNNPDVVAGAATVVICVPTPLSAEGGPDLRAVLAATDTIAARLRPGTLVILESTTYPGTTEELLLPRLAAGGLRVGVDFFLAFSPERIDPGNQRHTFANTPKVVGGVTAACTARAMAFYQGITQTVVQAKGTREAEMAKLLENTYRHVNIALVNEMLLFCHELNIDLWDVIACAATKPFGFEPFYPGPGVGGHCIPIDPKYLSHRVQARLGYPFRFVELAQEINAGMPAYVSRRVQDLLNDRGRALKGASVLLLGVTYKADISDQRESPAVPVAQKLQERGAVISYHDPYVAAWSVGAETVKRVPDLAQALRSCDVAVLLQPHRAYTPEQVAELAPLILDTRGRMPDAPNVEHL